jgi:hypothetical protein
VPSRPSLVTTVTMIIVWFATYLVTGTILGVLARQLLAVVALPLATTNLVIAAAAPIAATAVAVRFPPPIGRERWGLVAGPLALAAFSAVGVPDPGQALPVVLGALFAAAVTVVMVRRAVGGLLAGDPTR